MRRWLAVFLLVFLPLQSAWAVAAGYCQHESGAASQHFGHHAHQHQADDGNANGLGGGVDIDCSACHASCAAALPGAARLPAALPAFVESHPWREAALPSPPQPLPERPKWLVRA